jgi:hypothetical protein
MAKIPVLEVFGPTIQGEGRVIGRRISSLALPSHVKAESHQLQR